MRQIITAVVFFLVALTVSVEAKAQDVTVSEADFAKEVLAILKENYPDTDYTYEADLNQVTGHVEEEEGGPRFVYLGNIYNQSKLWEKNDRLIFLNKFLSQFNIDGQDAVSQASFIRSLMFRTRVEADFSFREFHVSREFLTVKEKIGDLYLELVADSDVSVALVNQTTLEERKISEKTALQRARQNLREVTPKNMWTKVEKHIWQSDIFDDFDAARVVAIYDDLKLPFGEDPIFFMPAHSVVLTSNSTDPKIIEKMVNEGMEQAADQRILSYALWKRDGDVWRQWRSQKTEPAYAYVSQHNMQVEAMNYDEQKRLLERRHEENGDDIFIASFNLYGDDDDAFYSLAIYSIGIVTYLPKVERVAIFDPDLGQDDGVLGWVDWDDFVEILNPKRVQKSYPDLYDLSETPSSKQLKSLKAVVTPFKEK